MSVMRYDMSTGENLTTKAVIKEDGSIEARSIITSIGVFPYRMKNGSIRQELRTTEEVFAPKFVESLKNTPIFVGHKVNTDGSLITDPVELEKHTVGYIGSDIIGNNVFVSADIKITRQDGLDAIKHGAQSFSVGYSCDVVEESGTWCGVHYDARQTNLIGQHTALVYAGRQGDQAVLRMDDAEMVIENTPASAVVDIKKSKEERMANMRTIQLDAVDYEADEVVINALKSAEAKLDSLQEELKAKDAVKSAIEAERDSMKDRLDAADKKVAEMEAAKLDEAEMTKRVNARIALVESAKKAEVEVKEDMADMDIRKAVIMKVYPATVLDGKNEAYVEARFDCALEDLAKKEVVKADSSVREASAPVAKLDNADSAKDARQKYIDRLSAQGRSKKEK